MGRERRSDGEVGRVYSGDTGTTSTGLRETGNHTRRQSHITQVDSLSQKRGLFSHITSKNRLNLSIGRGTGRKPTSSHRSARMSSGNTGKVNHRSERT